MSCIQMIIDWAQWWADLPEEKPEDPSALKEQGQVSWCRGLSNRDRIPMANFEIQASY